MEQARTLGYPSIVIGSMPLDTTQQATPASDAAAEIALLAGHASAYVATAGTDDPLEQRFGGTLTQSFAGPSPGAPPLLLLQSSTLGYAPSQAALYGDRPSEEAFNRQTAAALMMIDVAVDRLDRQTGLAPVTVMSEPLLEGLTLDESSGAVPLGWAQQLFAIAGEASPQRYLVKPPGAAEPRPAGPQRLVGLPLDQCRLWSASCAFQVPTDIAFTSSNTEVGRIVAARPATTGRDRRPEIVLDATGHVVDDPRGIFCPLGLGTTNVSVTALGQRVMAPVRVIPVPSFPTGDGESSIKATPIPEGTCGFPRFTREETPVENKPAPPTPKKPVPPLAPEPEPAAKPNPRPHPVPQPQPQPVPQAPAPVPAPPAPPSPVQPVAAEQARPPVAPAAKPPLPPPPAPPQGLQVQQVHQTQVQPFQAMQHQEQRREEYAYEADQAAVAYAHPPSPLPWEIAGGVAALALVMAGGGLAGRARRPALARATAGAGRRR
jgi:hypothetical protein